jgi:hypothetical protein
MEQVSTNSVPARAAAVPNRSELRQRLRLSFLTWPALNTFGAPQPRGRWAEFLQLVTARCDHGICPGFGSRLDRFERTILGVFTIIVLSRDSGKALFSAATA